MLFFGDNKHGKFQHKKINFKIARKNNKILFEIKH